MKYIRVEIHVIYNLEEFHKRSEQYFAGNLPSFSHFRATRWIQYLHFKNTSPDLILNFRAFE